MKFRVKMLPGDNTYLEACWYHGKYSFFLSESEENADFSDLTGPTFVQVFNKDSYNHIQGEYTEYLPKLDFNDKRFILVGDGED